MRYAKLTNFRMLSPGGNLGKIPSIPLKKPGSARLPGRHLALYGNMQVMNILRSVRLEALKEKKVVCRIDIRVPVEDAIRKVSAANLAESFILREGHLLNEVIDMIRDLIGAKKGKDKDGKEVDPFDVIRRYPGRLNKLWESSEFAHVRIFVWNAETIYGSCAVAAIRSPEDVESVTCVSCPGTPELTF